MAKRKIKALEVKHFSKKYRGRDNYAVRDSSFVVHKGEFHAFIGANGAGKTTTIKSIIGAYARFNGEINIFGDRYNSKEAKNKIGYIPEKADFPKGMSLAKYLYSMANLSGLKSHDAKKFAEEKIKEFGLTQVRKDSPNSFSSGQKKKVLLAQALVSNPELIIMDEPAANLDPKARDEFFEELKKLQKAGKTIFISSHILKELDSFTDHITILDNGVVAYTGSVAKLQAESALSYNFKFKTIKGSKDFKVMTKKLKTKIKDINQKELEIIFEVEKDIQTLIAKAHKAKIQITEYTRNILDLQTIYNNFVKVGSVDTPEHLKEIKKG